MSKIIIVLDEQRKAIEVSNETIKLIEIYQQLFKKYEDEDDPNWWDIIEENDNSKDIEQLTDQIMMYASKLFTLYELYKNVKPEHGGVGFEITKAYHEVTIDEINDGCVYALSFCFPWV